MRPVNFIKAACYFMRSTFYKIMIPILISTFIINSPAAGLNQKIENEEIWNRTIGKLLTEKLWDKKSAYDTYFDLMIPMISAFQTDDATKIRQFNLFFLRFSNEINYSELNSIDNPPGILNQLQFLSFVSEYLALCKEYNVKAPKELWNFLYTALKIDWEKESWWYPQCGKLNKYSYQGTNFVGFASMKDRVLWKIKNAKTKFSYSYCAAFFDEEFLLFNVAANLYFSKTNNSHDKFLTSILDIAFHVYRTSVVPTNNLDKGWLFQPGFWSDHPDYIYSGNAFLKRDLQPIKINNIAQDTSHSSRLPQQLLSLQRAFSLYNKNEANFFYQLRLGLTQQFVNKIMVKPNPNFKNYRVTNFMDGANGVYRYKYTTMGTNLGYGPFQLSGTIFSGFWSLLPYSSNKYHEIKTMYTTLCRRFPMHENELKTYVGPNTTRSTNIDYKLPDAYYNGLFKTTVCLASNIKS